MLQSTVVCEAAHAIKGKVSKKNGGTLIVAFNTQDLVDVPAGDEVPLRVTGKVRSDGSLIDFEGSDTVRVVDHGKRNNDGDEDEHDHFEDGEAQESLRQNY